MQTILIDTDVAIDFLRGESYAKNLIIPLWKNNTAFLNILTVYELHAGMREKEKNDTKNFIDACTIEYITIEIAEKGGTLRKQYKEKGITLTAIDCLIASTAILKGHKIATRNIKHYPNKELIIKL